MDITATSESGNRACPLQLKNIRVLQALLSGAPVAMQPRAFLFQGGGPSHDPQVRHTDTQVQSLQCDVRGGVVAQRVPCPSSCSQRQRVHACACSGAMGHIALLSSASRQRHVVGFMGALQDLHYARHAMLHGYLCMATLAIQDQVPRWPLRPKLHMMDHAERVAQSLAINPASWWTFQDEDNVGFSK